eukprot:TRINITY_DN237_c0_g1_i4.p1 TRINITY_DN237_c0_g1~~TRINITY_DN237_c0_g1_i4.p1  ORF type:complete len:242 (-),score=49.46 TRINITY_DN237_c0_g1_i4:99-770(-)
MRCVSLVSVLCLVACAYARRSINPLADAMLSGKVSPWTKADLEVPGTAHIPQEYPLYLQCDPIWAQDWMGANSSSIDTVCAQGCAMSSVAMALSGKGYKLGGYYPIYSGTLNAWLAHNQGYHCLGKDCDNLVLDAPNRIAPEGQIKFISENPPPSPAVMRSYVDAGNPMMMIHVRNQTHFVLVVGYDTVNSSIFYVNDPAIHTNTYTWNEIHDILLYWITPAK